MRFLQLFLALALVSYALMETAVHLPGEIHPPKMYSEVQKYFHKKMCYCIKERGGLCTSLKCCDIFQYVPYKVFIKLCKYGECKYVEKKVKKIVVNEKHAGVSA